MLTKRSLKRLSYCGCFAVALSLLVGEQALAQERRAPVRVVLAQEQPIQRVLEFAGSATAARAASLSAATSGLVSQLLVDVGDRVQQGQLLLGLDDELARFQLASDQAAQRRSQQALDDAQRRLAEARALATKQTIAETAVRDLESEAIEDEAELARLTALVGLSQTTLDRHRLSAPFDGVISARNTDLGEWVTPGDTVFSLVSLDELFVDLQVSEAYLGMIDADMPISLRLTGPDAETIEARIAATVPVTDPTARTFLVRARPIGSDAVLLPGMSAIASLTLDTGYTRVTVPRDAVLRFADGRSVVWVVVTRDGIEQAEQRLVDTGLSFSGVLEIVSGIKAGERVVVAGNEALRDEQPVAVLNGSAD